MLLMILGFYFLRNDHSTCAQCGWREQLLLWLHYHALKIQRGIPSEALLLIHLCSLMATLNPVFSIVFAKDAWLCACAVRVACVCQQNAVSTWHAFTELLKTVVYIYLSSLFCRGYVISSIRAAACDVCTMKHEASATRYLFYSHCVKGMSLLWCQ